MDPNDLTRRIQQAQHQTQGSQVGSWLGGPASIIAGDRHFTVDDGTVEWLVGPALQPIACRFTEEGQRRVVFVGPGVVLLFQEKAQA